MTCIPRALRISTHVRGVQLAFRCIGHRPQQHRELVHMFRVQYLANPRKDYQPIARRSVRGNVWVDVCKPVKRLSVAESIQRKAMVDLDARIRVRQMRA